MRSNRYQDTRKDGPWVALRPQLLATRFRLLKIRDPPGGPLLPALAMHTLAHRCTPTHTSPQLHEHHRAQAAFTSGYRVKPVATVQPVCGEPVLAQCHAGCQATDDIPTHHPTQTVEGAGNWDMQLRGEKGRRHDCCRPEPTMGADAGRFLDTEGPDGSKSCIP